MRAGQGMRGFMRSLNFILSAVKFETIHKTITVLGFCLFRAGGLLAYISTHWSL